MCVDLNYQRGYSITLLPLFIINKSIRMRLVKFIKRSQKRFSDIPKLYSYSLHIKIRRNTYTTYFFLIV